MNKNYAIKLFVLTTFLLLLHFNGRAQYPFSRDGNTKLFTDTTLSSVTYDLGDIRLFFKKKVLLKYLQKRLNEGVYRKMEARSYNDSNYMALLDILKKKFINPLYIKGDDVVFNKAIGEMERLHLQTNYVRALDKLFPYIIVNGDLGIYDKKRNRMVNFIIINQMDIIDFKGERQTLDIFYPDGTALYSIVNRRSMEGNDFN